MLSINYQFTDFELRSSGAGNNLSFNCTETVAQFESSFSDRRSLVLALWQWYYVDAGTGSGIADGVG